MVLVNEREREYDMEFYGFEKKKTRKKISYSLSGSASPVMCPFIAMLPGLSCI
jgi:hypothetical protein